MKNIKPNIWISSGSVKLTHTINSYINKQMIDRQRDRYTHREVEIEIDTHGLKACKYFEVLQTKSAE